MTTPPPPAPPPPVPAAPPPPAALAVAGLCKSFGGVRVLSDLTLSVPAAPDTSVAVLGQNGAGKTTLLNLVTRLIPADAGTISVFGQDMLRRPARHLARHGVARTFQSPRLLLDETCLGNVALGALSAARGHRSAAVRRAVESLERVGLAAHAGRTVGTLPFGSRKLVELARALAIAPRLLLLDEPAAGLSEAEERALAEILVALRASGITLLLIEHRMALVMATANRVVMMDSGSIVFDGGAAEAMASPLVRERYLGAGFDAGTGSA
jgi:ABC-type branched-subunit amino acid transport system ATPase component